MHREQRLCRKYRAMSTPRLKQELEQIKQAPSRDPDRAAEQAQKQQLLREMLDERIELGLDVDSHCLQHTLQTVRANEAASPAETDEDLRPRLREKIEHELDMRAAEGLRALWESYRREHLRQDEKTGEYKPISQEEFVQEVNRDHGTTWSQSKFSELLNGGRRITPRTLSILCRVFDVYPQVIRTELADKQLQAFKAAVGEAVSELQALADNPARRGGVRGQQTLEAIASRLDGVLGEMRMCLGENRLQPPQPAAGRAEADNPAPEGETAES